MNFKLLTLSALLAGAVFATVPAVMAADEDKKKQVNDELERMFGSHTPFHDSAAKMAAPAGVDAETGDSIEMRSADHENAAYEEAPEDEDVPEGEAEMPDGGEY